LVWPPGAAHRSESLRGSSSIWSLLVITAMLGGATAVLYVSMVSPRHATTWRHLAMLWPLLAVLVASLLWQRAFGRGLASVLCVALVAASLSGIRSDRRVEWPAVVPDPRRPVLLDRSAHGVLPRVLWYATPGTRVFAAKQSYLLDHPAEWLDTLGDEPIYAATAIQFGTTQEARDRLLALFRTRYLEDGDRRRSPNAEWIGWRRIGSRPPPASPRSDR
jgi:hypothetical protein